MCSATLGATPVNRWTWAASATFSYGVRGTPFWVNTLNLVPELPKAHDGSSIRCARSAATTAGLLITSASVAQWADLSGGSVSRLTGFQGAKRPDRTQLATGFDYFQLPS